MDRAARAPAEGAVDAVRAPFLYSSPVGRGFLESAGPARALARGEPAAFCPISGLGEATTPRAAAVEALERCLEARDEARRACGCKLLVANEALLAPPADFAYAPGVGARLIGLGDGRPLVAREAPAEGGASLALFEDAAGPVALAELRPDGRARLRLRDEEAWLVGRRELRGWRRGRLRERLLLEDGAGRRVIALIGFEPADIAAAGSALGAWPDRRPGG